MHFHTRDFHSSFFIVLSFLSFSYVCSCANFTNTHLLQSGQLICLMKYLSPIGFALALSSTDSSKICMDM